MTGYRLRFAGLWPAAETWLDRWTTAAALAFVFWLAFSSPWLFGGQVIPWDAKDFYYPAFRALAASLGAGESGFWNPWLRAGSAAIADPQSWLFTPTVRLAAHLNASPSMQFLDAVQLLHLLAGGLGTLVLGRVLGQRPMAALLGAIVLMFGGAAAARLQHSMMIVSYGYLPWCLLTLRLSIAPAALRHRLLAAAGLGVIGSAMAVNRDQVAYLNAIFLGVAALWWLGEAARREGIGASLGRLAALLPAAFIGLALLAIPALLTLDVLAASTRNILDFTVTARASLQPASLLSAIMPSFFGGLDRGSDYWGPGTSAWLGFSDVGIINDGTTSYLYLGLLPVAIVALVLASGALRGRFFSRSETGLFLCGLAAAILYAIGAFTPFFRLLYDGLPGVSLYRRPNDAVFLINALAAFLTAAAAQTLMSAPHQPPVASARSWLALAAAAAAVALAAFWLADRFHQTAEVAPQLAVAVLAMAAALALLARLPSFSRRAVWSAGIACLAAIDLVAHNSGSVLNARPAQEIAAYRPEGVALAKEIERHLRVEGKRYRAEIFGVDRRPGLDGGGSWQNAAMIYGIEQTLGYDPLLKAEYASVVGAEQNSNGPVRRLTSLFTGYSSSIARLLGIRVVLTGQPIESVCPPAARRGLQLVAQRDGAYVYLNPSALPRVMLVPRGVPDEGGPLPEQADQTVLIRGLAAGDAATIAARPGVASITHYGSDRIEIVADSEREGWLLLNERFHPAWRATIDSVETTVHRANRLFRAVRLPAGRHKIAFSFEPLRPSELWRIAQQSLPFLSRLRF